MEAMNGQPMNVSIFIAIQGYYIGFPINSELLLIHHKFTQNSNGTDATMCLNAQLQSQITPFVSATLPFFCSSNCQKDYIVLERSFEASANPNRICGHYFNYRYSSHDNKMMVRYHTDGNNNADTRPAYGFRVSYESFGKLSDGETWQIYASTCS